MASHSHGNRSDDLTRNEQLVQDVLAGAGEPLSAYRILDALRGEGVKAPLQVYRALERLVERGLAHRLESMNSFIACKHPDCDNHAMVAFGICEGCGKVREYTDPSLARALETIAVIDDFEVKRTVVELRGICAGCAGRDAD